MATSPSASAPLGADALVEGLTGTAAFASRTAARRFELIDELRRVREAEWGITRRSPDDLDWRALRAEVAAALSVSERMSAVLLEQSRLLVHDFPRTLNGLRKGTFSERHAQIVVDGVRGLSEQHWAEYESLLLDVAEELVPPRFEKYAAEVREALEPQSLIERHRDAVTLRRTLLEAAPDGMAYYGAFFEAQDAVGADAAVTGIARGLLVDGETRTLAQIKADVLRDLLLDATGVSPSAEPGAAPVASPAAQRGVRAEVLIHVPVLTATGATDDAALLDGYGPIDAETARALCADAPGFVRVLTDPADGAVLSFGRTTYRPPAEMKRFLRHRDEVCRFVGCTRSARFCDIDHTRPWSEDGETVESNLAHLCRGHHRLKERNRWRVDNSPGGVLSWTSPTGRTYTTRPARRALRVAPIKQWVASANAADTPPPF